MDSIRIKPSKLAGKLIVPPSKSLSHRAIICASLSEKESIINNLTFSDDIKATIEGMKKLGAHIIHTTNNAIIRRNNIINKNIIIDCNESGSTLRFMIPLSMALTELSNFTGSNKLFERPLDVYYDIFRKQKIDYKLNGEYPLSIKGKLLPGIFEIPGNISSQFISGLLFSLPLLDGNSTISITESYESKGYVNMTIDVLEKFGVHIEKSGDRTLYIQGKQKYTGTVFNVEGDYSQAAFFLVANELGSEIELLGLKQNSLQGDKEILNIIDMYKTYSNITIDASQIPDLVPIISVLASLKENCTTDIINAQRLRIKESDRLKAVSTELTKLGASVKETNEGLIIEGKNSLKGNTVVNSWNDHRIAMALAIAATKCEHDIILENHKSVKKSYPHFWVDYKSLGGAINELNNR
jgi:3-phosphoshikimate 1-carboxyvinyltransferase